MKLIKPERGAGFNVDQPLVPVKIIDEVTPPPQFILKSDVNLICVVKMNFSFLCKVLLLEVIEWSNTFFQDTNEINPGKNVNVSDGQDEVVIEREADAEDSDITNINEKPYKVITSYCEHLESILGHSLNFLLDTL